MKIKLLTFSHSLQELGYVPGSFFGLTSMYIS